MTAFDIIGMTGSVGAIRAIGQVLDALPATFPVPIVVAQHRGDLDGPLVDLWQRRSRLSVRVATEGERVLPSTVHVGPPCRDVHVDGGGQLRLTSRSDRGRGRTSANALFRSIAWTYNERAIAVVLSGRLDDGAEGVKAIKAAGGRVLAQLPSEAERPEMPTAAIASGCVDLVLPIRAIAPALVALVMVAGAAELLRVPMPPWVQFAG